MKVVYEAADIDVEKNPLHDFIDKQLIVACFAFVLTQMGKPKLEGPISEEEKAETRKDANVLIAQFLNGMEKDGWELVKKEESIPSVYREGLLAQD